jgi:hypothetical protein
VRISIIASTNITQTVARRLWRQLCTLPKLRALPTERAGFLSLFCEQLAYLIGCILDPENRYARDQPGFGCEINVPAVAGGWHGPC